MGEPAVVDADIVASRRTDDDEAFTLAFPEAILTVAGARWVVA